MTKQAKDMNGTDCVKAPHAWVCGACGKQSRSRYGFDAKENNVASPGWDEACVLNAVLCVITELPTALAADAEVDCEG
jgi:hypothetical protein